MNDEDFVMVEAMERYGGSFVKSLANCFFHADDINFDKLKRAFPEYWKEYEEQVK
jgi:pyruvate/2-oxoacid:ferredoxin oxidoreductase beta subunit